jgi:hypothetical protein
MPPTPRRTEPQPPPATLPPGQVADTLGLATGAAAAAPVAAGAVTGAVAASAVVAASGTILAGFRRLFRKRRDDIWWLRQALQEQYPQRTETEIATIVDHEIELEREFQAKALQRLEMDVPEALKIADPEKRNAAIQKIIEREKRYSKMREEAASKRASYRAELIDVKHASPEGAYWKLDPSVKKHTLDCILMGERFWPWEVLDQIHPQLHVGCRCHLYTKDEAVSRGLMDRNYQPNVHDDLVSAHAIIAKTRRLQEMATVEEIDRYIEVLIEESFVGPRGRQKCKYGDHPATKSLVWAERAAFVPVCDKHEQRARDRLAEHGDDVEDVLLIETGYDERLHPRNRRGEWMKALGSLRPHTGDPMNETYAELGMSDETILAGLRAAVEEQPERTTHGYTGTNAFFLVGEQPYVWNDYNNIPRDDRSRAIPVHSHSSDGIPASAGPDYFDHGYVEQPLNGTDFAIWFKAMRSGTQGPRQVMLYADGTADIVGITHDTDEKVLRYGEKRTRDAIPFNGNPAHDRAALRDWLAQHRFSYHEQVRWATPDEAAHWRSRHPSKSIRTTGRPRLVEARYDEKEHPRGRHGKWIRKNVLRALRHDVPTLPPTPLQSRATGQGRYVWMRGRHVFVPRNREFKRVLDGHVFESPAGSTNIYRNGNLVQVEGQPAPPHHHDLNPPAQPDIRNIPGTPEWNPPQADPGSGGGRYSLRDVEDGFARVVNDTGRAVGHVTREKHGSTRTGTMWFAHHRVYGNLGLKDTRAGAIKLVTDKQDELAAKMAARRPGGLGDPGSATLETEHDLPGLSPEAAAAGILASQQRDDYAGTVFGNFITALHAQRGDMPPVNVGDRMSAVGNALHEYGFQQSTAGLRNFDDGRTQVGTWRHGGSHAHLTLTIDARRQTVTGVQWTPGEAGWNEPQPPDDHPPRDWEEFADEVRGITMRLSHQYGVEPRVGEVVHVSDQNEMGDHAGTWSPDDGTIWLGAETTDILGLHERVTNAPDAALVPRRHLDNPRGVFGSYKVGTHEALHGVNSTSGLDYGSGRSGKAFEEALVEELAHVEAATLMREHGVPHVLAWARQNPQDAKVLGSYQAYRARLDRLLNIARVPPEEREDYLRHLKFETEPTGAARTADLASVIAENTRMTYSDAHALVLDTMTNDTHSARALQDERDFVPIVRPDLRDFPAADGAMVNGKLMRPGSKVLLDWGRRVETIDARGHRRSRWKKEKVEAEVLAIHTDGADWSKYRLDVRTLDNWRVSHGISDKSVLDVLDEGQPQPGVSIDGLRKEIDGKLVTRGAVVQLKPETSGGTPGRALTVVGWGPDRDRVIARDAEYPDLGVYELDPAKLDVVQPGPEPRIVALGDLITYTHAHGTSEARVLKVTANQAHVFMGQ